MRGSYSATILPASHVQHAVGVEIDLGHLVRDEQDRQPLGREPRDDLEDAGAGADVDPDRRGVEDDELEPDGEPFGDGDALLVAARKRRDGVGRLADLDRQLVDPARDQRVLLA